MDIMNIEQISLSIGIDTETLLNLFSLFIRQTAADLVAIQSAVKEKDWDTLKQTAHSIKGAALNLELEEIAAAAKEIEEKALEGRMEILSPHIAALESGFEEVKKIQTG
jgi:HPt (histidine-containing phosphotransfer) domain-containing protein